MSLVSGAEIQPALLQGAVTLGTAALCWYLFGRYRRRDVFWWAVAWSLYVLRLGAIVAFLVSGTQGWLFAHQVLTGWTALALLWAALTFTSRVAWRPIFILAPVFSLVWSYAA